MPVYEYLCPQCFRELEVLRPIDVANEHHDCPDCGGEAVRLMSGFGSRQGSYIQPSAGPFRDGSAFVPIGRAGVTTVTVQADVTPVSRFEGQPRGVAVVESSRADSEPNRRKVWSFHKWGVASLLRHFRKDADLEPAEAMQYPKVTDRTVNTENPLEGIAPTMPAEDSLDEAPGTDQQVCHSSVKPWLGEGIAETARDTESVIRVPDEPVVFSDKSWWPASFVMQWPEEEPQPALTAQSHYGASDRQATTTPRLLRPRDNYEWFLFVTIVQAFTVVPLVWILGAMFFF